MNAIIDEDKDFEMFVRFLDENILVKRDLDTSNKLFTPTEVVNFTFDEFRDYAITKYLFEYLLSKSRDQFYAFVDENLKKESLILEGCSSFLFYFSKKQNDPELNQFLQYQEWYDSAFIKSIFSFKDEVVTSEDIDYLKKLFYYFNLQKRSEWEQ